MIMKTERQRMLKEIETEARYTASYTGRKSFSERVMAAIKDVPRDKFVSSNDIDVAFYNGPLPIGHGQTISQPYIVALMTDMLDLTKDSVVLEVGTGSGYQAAILSELARKVYSVERIPELYKASSERLKQMGYNNIETQLGNGSLGWLEKAPFDAIIVTAAAAYMPQALIDQLKPGGRMLIPVGLSHMHQELMLVTKDQHEATSIKSILGVAFVPLVMDE